MDGKVDSILFNGANSRVLVRSGNGELIEADVTLTGGHNDLKPGEEVTLIWSSKQTMSFGVRAADDAKGHQAPVADFAVCALCALDRAFDHSAASGHVLSCHCGKGRRRVSTSSASRTTSISSTNRSTGTRFCAPGRCPFW
jgi:hypothetical protein